MLLGEGRGQWCVVRGRGEDSGVLLGGGEGTVVCC